MCRSLWMQQRSKTRHVLSTLSQVPSPHSQRIWRRIPSLPQSWTQKSGVDKIHFRAHIHKHIYFPWPKELSSSKLRRTSIPVSAINGMDIFCDRRTLMSKFMNVIILRGWGNCCVHFHEHINFLWLKVVLCPLWTHQFAIVERRAVPIFMNTSICFC
jgi:hypothetical protein